jgi:hypothetical protein
MSTLSHVISHSLMITLFVFVMMVIIDYVNVLTRGRMEEAVKGGKWRQYTLASFLGSTPGCLGAFMNVSFYAHGLLSFGAIVGGMVATSGDEAFVMLALFPKKALLLFTLLFVLGIIGAWLSDKTASRIGIIPCENCELQIVHAEDNCQCFEITALIKFSKLALVRYLILFVLALSIVAVTAGQIGPQMWNWVRITLLFSLAIATCILFTVPEHYLDEHIWQHLIKEHLWRVFLWTFFALLLITLGLKYWNIEAFVKAHLAWVFLTCALVGLIPESGPHLVFVVMFANGLVPFSILLTSSIVQDGHGMLPMFSYSLKDALLIKLFNLLLALLVGLPLFLLGW